MIPTLSLDGKENSIMTMKTESCQGVLVGGMNSQSTKKFLGPILYDKMVDTISL